MVHFTWVILGGESFNKRSDIFPHWTATTSRLISGGKRVMMGSNTEKSDQIFWTVVDGEESRGRSMER